MTSCRCTSTERHPQPHPSVRAAGDQGPEAVHHQHVSGPPEAGPGPAGPARPAPRQLLPAGLGPGGTQAGVPLSVTLIVSGSCCLLILMPAPLKPFQVFIGFVLKQFEFIEVGQFR